MHIPIIFNTEMLQAIIDDPKIQTIRPVKLQIKYEVGWCLIN